MSEVTTFKFFVISVLLLGITLWFMAKGFSKSEPKWWMFFLIAFVAEFFRHLLLTKIPEIYLVIFHIILLFGLLYRFGKFEKIGLVYTVVVYQVVYFIIYVLINPF